MKNRTTHTTWSWRKEGWLELVALLVVMSSWYLIQSTQPTIPVILTYPVTFIVTPVTSWISHYHRPLRPFSQWFNQAEQIKQLTALLAKSEAELATLKGVSAENQQLRQLLENRHLDLQERRLGKTVANYAVPSIWLGQDSDIGVGSLVLYKGTLLGRVSAVSAGLAQVQLVTESDDFRLVVSIDGSITGVTSGNAGQLHVENIPPDALIQPGQQVVTVGQPGVPPNLLVGITKSGIAYENGQAVVLVDQLVTFYHTPLVEVLPL